VDVKDNLVTEMKGELKSLTIDNLIIPDDNNNLLIQSRIILICYNIVETAYKNMKVLIVFCTMSNCNFFYICLSHIILIFLKTIIFQSCFMIN
jgi:hypothetical protein